MKGKRYPTEDKIRILREADRGERTIKGIGQEANISEVTFHRWKKQFGHMEVNEAQAVVVWLAISKDDGGGDANGGS